MLKDGDRLVQQLLQKQLEANQRTLGQFFQKAYKLYEPDPLHLPLWVKEIRN